MQIEAVECDNIEEASEYDADLGVANKSTWIGPAAEIQKLKINR